MSSEERKDPANVVEEGEDVEFEPMEPTLEHIVKSDTLRWIFVGGKGGVGKTTVSSSLSTLIAKEKFSLFTFSMTSNLLTNNLTHIFFLSHFSFLSLSLSLSSIYTLSYPHPYTQNNVFFIGWLKRLVVFCSYPLTLHIILAMLSIKNFVILQHQWKELKILMLWLLFYFILFIIILFMNIVFLFFKKIDICH